MFEFPSVSSSVPACLDAESAPASQRLLRRAERRITSGNYAQAIADLRRAMGQGADAYACTLRIADLQCRRQKWEQAIRAAEQAIALVPLATNAWEMLMAIAMRIGDFERAQTAGRAIIKIRPRYMPAYDALGALYMQRGDVDSAMRVLDALIRQCPHEGIHHFKKGLLCQHKGEIALAVYEFTTALELAPNGQCALEARSALECLDAFQLNQILTLGMEDMVFRARLLRDAEEASAERGFCLSEHGYHILGELCAQLLPHTLGLCRRLRYN